MKAKGKQLESEIQKYLKHNGDLYCRFADSRASGGLSQPQPADFIVFPTKGVPCFIEAKETAKIKLPISNFRPRQLQTMEKCRDVQLLEYYVIVKLDNKKYILVHSNHISECITLGIKSLDLQDYLKFPNINDCMDFLFQELED